MGENRLYYYIFGEESKMNEKLVERTAQWEAFEMTVFMRATSVSIIKQHFKRVSSPSNIYKEEETYFLFDHLSNTDVKILGLIKD